MNKIEVHNNPSELITAPSPTVVKPRVKGQLHQKLTNLLAAFAFTVATLVPKYGRTQDDSDITPQTEPASDEFSIDLEQFRDNLTPEQLEIFNAPARNYIRYLETVMLAGSEDANELYRTFIIDGIDGYDQLKLSDPYELISKIIDKVAVLDITLRRTEFCESYMEVVEGANLLNEQISSAENRLHDLLRGSGINPEPIPINEDRVAECEAFHVIDEDFRYKFQAFFEVMKQLTDFLDEQDFAETEFDNATLFRFADQIEPAFIWLELHFRLDDSPVTREIIGEREIQLIDFERLVRNEPLTEEESERARMLMLRLFGPIQDNIDNLGHPTGATPYITGHELISDFDAVMFRLNEINFDNDKNINTQEDISLYLNFKFLEARRIILAQLELFLEDETVSDQIKDELSESININLIIVEELMTYIAQNEWEDLSKVRFFVSYLAELVGTELEITDGVDRLGLPRRASYVVEDLADDAGINSVPATTAGAGLYGYSEERIEGVVRTDGLVIDTFNRLRFSESFPTNVEKLDSALKILDHHGSVQIFENPENPTGPTLIIFPENHATADIIDANFRAEIAIAEYVDFFGSEGHDQGLVDTYGDFELQIMEDGNFSAQEIIDSNPYRHAISSSLLSYSLFQGELIGLESPGLLDATDYDIAPNNTTLAREYNVSATTVDTNSPFGGDSLEPILNLPYELTDAIIQRYILDARNNIWFENMVEYAIARSLTPDADSRPFNNIHGLICGAAHVADLADIALAGGYSRIVIFENHSWQ